MLRKSFSQTTLGYGLLVAFLLLGFLLRFVYLTEIPPGFNWDEASVGYNAYCLSKTGKDEFGKPWPIIMEAFGEHKIGLYSIFIVPLIRLFGLSIFTVRFPNVLFGCLIILASFYLALQIFKKTLPASLVAGLVAISPWAIHTSRFTLEWYFGIPLMIFGFAFLLKSSQKNSFLLLSALLLAISLYSYHSLRLFIPFLLLGYAIIYRKQLLKKKQLVLLGFALGLVLLLPLFISMQSTKFLARPKAVAIFTNENLQNQLMEGMYRHTVARLPFVRLFNNKVVFYGKEFLDRYLAHFSPQFLFSGEDVTPRIGVERVGKLYFISLPFLLLGFTQLLKKNTPLNLFLLLWFFLAPISSSLTIDTPHALRSFILTPVLQIITVKGMIVVFRYLYRQKPYFLIPVIAITTLAYLLGLGYFCWRYFLFYRLDSTMSWQAGHKEMVQKLNQYQERFETIVVTTHYGQPHIFIAFFTPIDPWFYQQEVAKDNQQGIFNARIPYLGKIQFRQISSEDFCLPNTLIIAEKEKAANLVPLDVITVDNPFHESEIVFEMFDTNEVAVQEKFCQKD